ncbi:hypothetical protein ACN38_g5832 [Penicillium nordicum]|uniref:Uncharacterized protein n=1 Tax=Penicillium nordicum TaxID=229535 RepID=A0A0M9WFU5_9EURO|nr:hypothetical protein ACN38_g5832 [Penicillium nordicum]
MDFSFPSLSRNCQDKHFFQTYFSIKNCFYRTTSDRNGARSTPILLHTLRYLLPAWGFTGTVSYDRFVFVGLEEMKLKEKKKKKEKLIINAKKKKNLNTQDV